MSDDPRCECLSLPNQLVVDMASPGAVMNAFESIANRGEPLWWMEASRCAECHTPWLVGHEELQNDLFLLRRLSESEAREILDNRVWPQDFDQYEFMIRLGRDAGHSVRWVDPISDSSLLRTVTLIAGQRSGVRVSELAELLNLDFETASTIAEQAMIENGATIVRDDESWK
jgi:hypothetical protein